MKVKTGYLYHISDDFFRIYSDYCLMNNHEMGRTRPTYFTIKDKDILWFIPLSTKVSKYEKIVNQKIKKYGYCNTILIRDILSKKQVILLQNAFPTLEKYITHVHMYNGVPAHVSDALKEDILRNFKKMLNMKKNGLNLFFVDIDKLREELDKELISN